VRIGFAGTPEVAVPSLRALAAQPGLELLVVISRPDAPTGRGRATEPSPVSKTALELGLDLQRPARPSDPALLARLKALQLDAIAVVAYGAMIPDQALTIPRHGWINLHFSLLPAWRGAAPVQRAIERGDDIGGATTFQLVHELDAGPVYGHLTYRLPLRGTAGEVLQTLAHDGVRLLVDTLAAVANGSARPQAQAAAEVSYAHKLTPDDARVNWNRPAQALDRQIRACTPAPGAWSEHQGQRLGLGPLASLGDRLAKRVDLALEPGQLDVTKHEVWIGTADAAVQLDRVKPAGKRPMPAADWARGQRLSSGDRL